MFFTSLRRANGWTDEIMSCLVTTKDGPIRVVVDTCDRNPASDKREILLVFIASTKQDERERVTGESIEWVWFPRSSYRCVLR